MENFDISKVWPDWKATRVLGEGSFGKVYEIVRNNFGIEEHCALKVITIPSSTAELQSMRSEGMDDASASEYYKGLVEEFVQEIALMSKLKGNLNIVGYEDYAVIEHKDTIGWDILIRMELLTALPSYIQQHPLTINDILKLGTDICSALELCHSHKIIHRDIKPDNIFVSANGDFKLGDFGVARTIEKTVSGLSKKGTYTYMAPEVYKGEAYGTNVDLYSLGIVMYKLLNNNREPFLPPHPETIKYSDKNNALVRRLNGEVIPPPANCDKFLGQVVLKSINFHSPSRYQLPSAMKADIQSIKKSLESGVAPILQADHIARSQTNRTGSIPPQGSVSHSQGNSPYYQMQHQMNNSYRTPNTAGSVAPRNTAGSVAPRPQVPIQPNPQLQYQQATNPHYQQTRNTYSQMAGYQTAQTPAYRNSQVVAQQVSYQPPMPDPNEKRNNVLRVAGNIIGWIGAIMWILLMLNLDFAFFLLALVVTTFMILLCCKKLEKNRKGLSIAMLILSFITFNPLNIVASILFLCMKPAR